MMISSLCLVLFLLVCVLGAQAQLDTTCFGHLENALHTRFDCRPGANLCAYTAMHHQLNVAETAIGESTLATDGGCNDVQHVFDQISLGYDANLTLFQSNQVFLVVYDTAWNVVAAPPDTGDSGLVIANSPSFSDCVPTCTASGAWLRLPTSDVIDDSFVSELRVVIFGEGTPQETTYYMLAYYSALSTETITGCRYDQRTHQECGQKQARNILGRVITDMHFAADVFIEFESILASLNYPLYEKPHKDILSDYRYKVATGYYVWVNREFDGLRVGNPGLEKLNLPTPYALDFPAFMATRGPEQYNEYEYRCLSTNKRSYMIKETFYGQTYIIGAGYRVNFGFKEEWILAIVFGAIGGIAIIVFCVFIILKGCRDSDVSCASVCCECCENTYEQEDDGFGLQPYPAKSTSTIGESISSECTRMRETGILNPVVLSQRQEELEQLSDNAFKGCAKGDLQAVKDWCMNPENCSNTPENFTILRTAAQFGHLHIVEYLCDERKANVNALGQDGLAPIFFAAKWNRLEIMDALIKRGASCQNIANPSKYAKEPLPPLFIAAKYGCVGAVVKLIAAGVNVNTGKMNGVTPFFIACKYGHAGVVQALIDAGAMTQKPNPRGKTPRAVATQFVRTDVIEALNLAGVK